jgi:UDP-2,3-diacylglucosamine pyrophosphatase LpxH
MSDVRYVCVSDLHFGAANSLLTNIIPGTITVEPSAPSVCLTAFVECLEKLIAANEDQSRKPDLVLNGDVLELALAQDNVAAMAFERFLELVFVKQRLFDKVHYLPGNHDHHVWETAREKQYAAYVASETGDLEPPWHATNLSARSGDIPVESELIGALMQRHHLGVRPEVRYPTFGLFSADRSRGAVFHHGHYIESIYLLMSRLQKVVFPDSQLGTKIWEWEAENFAWIDFFWSTLGRSGSVGTDVGVLYDLLQSPDARELLAGRIANIASERVPAIVRPVARPLIKRFIEHEANSAKPMERRNVVVPDLSKDGEDGLTALLTGPLAAQIRLDNADQLPRQTTFVFGHTHKPFQRHTQYDGYPGGVAIYNTGGWVVDERQPVPVEGAAVVVLDEDLNAAALRLYNQQASGPPPVVRVDCVEPEGNPLYDHFAKLKLTEDCWARLATVVAHEVPHRIELLDQMIAQGMAALRGSG